MRDLIRATCAGLVAILVVGAASAVDYKNEFEKKVKSTQNIGTLGNGLAGDQVNFYNGMTSFSAVDATIPGNSSLPVALKRSYSVEFGRYGGRAFGDWDLDVPFISTVMTAAGGWISTDATPTNRCSVSASTVLPPTVIVQAESGPNNVVHGFAADDYWHGFTLHLPDGDQSMLIPATTNTDRPTAGGPYYWTTNKDWWISCLTPAQTVGGGQGFLAISPDGTKYWFNRLGGVGAVPVTATENFDGPQTWYYTLDRAEYRMYVTRIEDRFGNWVQYDWSTGRLGAITSNDGRTITINWSVAGLIDSISDGTRTTRYTYALHNSDWLLSQVTLDDGSSWKYSLEGLHGLALAEAECFTAQQQLSTWDCYGNNTGTGLSYSAYVQHPSGARIDFVFEQHFQYSPSSGFYGYYPLAIKTKTISGPGLVAASWSYGFSPSRDATRTACRAGTCPQRIFTDEVAPDGSLTRRVFGTVLRVDESLLQGELRGAATSGLPSGGSPPITCSTRWGCSTVIGEASPITGTVPVFYEESDFRYVPAGTSLGYTASVGANPARGETFSSTTRLPVKTRIVSRQGATFTSDTTWFNQFAQPQDVTRSSAGLAGPAASYSRSETTTYKHDFAKWVIGLPEKTVVAGKIASQTDYDSVSMLPIRTYAFGALGQTLTYNADGTLATLADGNGKVTTVSSWYRGMPRVLGFPTQTGMTAVVNADGTVQSVTNEVSSTSSYTYDPVGRLSKVRFPTESPAWNDNDLAFVRVDAAEYGLPAGHWRQTVTTGNGRVSTFFDGRWQPVLTLTEDLANSASRSFVIKRFDGMGRLVYTSYPVANASVTDALQGVSVQYDALGRAVRSVQDAEPELGALVTATDYLPGFVTRVTNPRGYSTSTYFQALDAPAEDLPVQITAPEGVTTVIMRDIYGKPRQVTRSGPGG